MCGKALQVNLAGMILIDRESSDEAPPRQLTETALTFYDEFICILETWSVHTTKMVLNQVQSCMQMFCCERFIHTATQKTWMVFRLTQSDEGCLSLYCSMIISSNIESEIHRREKKMPTDHNVFSDFPSFTGVRVILICLETTTKTHRSEENKAV